MSSNLVNEIAKKHNISRNRARKLIEEAKRELSDKRVRSQINFRLRNKYERNIEEDEEKIL